MSRKVFCSEVRKAIKDERDAARLYLRTANRAPRRSVARIILAIRADERRHRHIFKRLRNRYCK